MEGIWPQTTPETCLLDYTNDTNYLGQLVTRQPLDLPYNRFVGPTYNTSISSPLVTLSRVTSDYMLVFDIKNIIHDMTTPNLNVNISTWNSTGNFDGRVKTAQIVYGWNTSTGDDVIHYWINEGHDPITKYASNPFYNTTQFNSVGNNSKAQLWIGILNNATCDDGVYKWNGFVFNPSVIQQGTYGALTHHQWNTRTKLFMQTNNELSYNNGTNPWYKINFAVLSVQENE
jgi:hypothetical protein